MLPYRVYLPQELEAMSPLTPRATAGHQPAPEGRGRDAGPRATGGLRVLPAVLMRIVARGRLRRPASGTI